MACQKREKTGSCPHYQCPFADETLHGYQCVDILSGKVGDFNVSFCEVGDGCLEKCLFSYKKGDGSNADRAAKAWSVEVEKEFKE